MKRNQSLFTVWWSVYVILRIVICRGHWHLEWCDFGNNFLLMIASVTAAWGLRVHGCPKRCEYLFYDKDFRDIPGYSSNWAANLLQLCIFPVTKISGSIFWIFPVHSFPYKGGISSLVGELDSSFPENLFFILALPSIQILWVPTSFLLNSSIYSRSI